MGLHTFIGHYLPHDGEKAYKGEKVKRWKGEKVKGWKSEKVKKWKGEKVKKWKGEKMANATFTFVLTP